MFRAAFLPVAGMSSRDNIRALTSIRGMAAWWVVLYHFREYIPGIAGTVWIRVMAHGYLAVDLFFVLSGFVIGLNYASYFQVLRLNHICKFLWLRLARIYPLHFIML